MSTNPYRQFSKRCLDLAITLPLLVVLSPLLATIALLVRWKLGSPVFFWQQRLGFHGKRFWLVKYRTMTDAPVDSNNPLDDETRLTKFGKILRATSLDELPELWNVLRGDMSLVGPRPLLVNYAKLYTPTQALRHEAKAGITGWAQVNGRNSLSWEEKFGHDVWYVRHQSMWLDIKILFLTIHTMLTRRGVHAKSHATMPLFTGATMTIPSGPVRIYLSPPHMSPVEREMLLDAFDSNWIAPLGPHVDAFEDEIKDKLGAAHAVALSSGTAALHMALLAVGVKPGDKVVTSTLTFAATANVIRYVGATPVFIDSDQATWNMDANLLAKALRAAAMRNQLPTAAIVVDVFGQCADYDSINTICQEYGIPVIEDAAESLGATYCGRQAGTLGDIGCFSFNGNKIITTSGGGMLVTDNSSIAADALHLATQARDPAPHYQHSKVGYNYRLSNLLAAVGRGQLKALDQRVTQRRENFERYHEALSDIPCIDFMPEADFGRATRWLTVVTIDSARLGATPTAVRMAMEAANIECRHLWKPMHLQPVNADCQVWGGDVAEELFRRGLCLPSGSTLTEQDTNRVVQVMREAIRTPVSTAA